MYQMIKKALIYRIIIVITQFFFIYLISGSLSYATSISISFAILATIIHIGFEKVWHALENS